MSNMSEDGSALQNVAGSDSFWEIGQYKRTVKRIDHGLDLCHDLVSMVKERGEIEAMHAKQLTQWSKKWADLISKGPEYGTIQAAWRAVLEEAEKNADLHINMRDRLQNEVQNTIKLWSKDQFHKNAFGHLKESKEIEESFKKAQKAWAKLYTKVDKCKKDYHVACRAERSTIIQEKNAQGDTSVSTDQARKLTEKVEKCGEEVQKTRENYQKALAEINANNAKYMEDMCQVFERCQEMERKRLKFFKEMLLNVHKCLDLSNERSLNTIYENFHDTVNLADDSQDLKWWSQNHGTDMAMNWPTFDEYTPELRRIGKETKNKDGIMLVGTKPTVPNSEYYQRQTSDNSSIQRNGSKYAATNGTSKNTAPAPQRNDGPTMNGDSKKNGEQSPNVSPPLQKSSAPTVESDKSRQVNGRQNASDPNPFDDDWDTTPERVLNETPSAVAEQAAVVVRALYDYEGQEEDELSFKKGETLDKLKDEDEQGWCTGRKDGKIGLYPANYVEIVKPTSS
uniref:Protein kinase C and casein kinase substrate in neurons protein 1 n=1 Tax=Romanomermis culicivorax TaxID=13658 RepID=A0A915JAF8_ROMCU